MTNSEPVPPIASRIFSPGGPFAGTATTCTPAQQVSRSPGAAPAPSLQSTSRDHSGYACARMESSVASSPTWRSPRQSSTSRNRGCAESRARARPTSAGACRHRALQVRDPSRVLQRLPLLGPQPAQPRDPAFTHGGEQLRGGASPPGSLGRPPQRRDDRRQPRQPSPDAIGGPPHSPHAPAHEADRALSRQSFKAPLTRDQSCSRQCDTVGDLAQVFRHRRLGARLEGRTRARQ